MSKGSMSKVEQAAALLVENRVSGQTLSALPQQLAPRAEIDGYRIQSVLHRRLTDLGYGAVTGHKIGCTTSVMQEYLGIPNPCAGGVFDQTVHHDHGMFAATGVVRLGVECEIAVVLAADLPPRAAPYTRDSVATAVAGCLAAIEVVADRYADFAKLGAPTLIADDFFNAGAVLGPVLDGFDLDQLPDVTASMLIDNREVSRGVGADIMSHPLEALAWFANNASQRGVTLRAGEFVLLGSVVPVQWIQTGACVQIINDPLGTVSVTIT
jgi:2-oxo-3-hexenedioate decarboxylase/2-keto-4-pentenoate hydratase